MDLPPMQIGQQEVLKQQALASKSVDTMNTICNTVDLTRIVLLATGTLAHGRAVQEVLLIAVVL